MNVEIYSRDGQNGNIYLINADNSREVIVIDPGIFNSDLLNMIEGDDREIRHILITHSHPHSRSGIETILKIYRADLYFAGNLLSGEILSKRMTFTLSGCEIEVIPVICEKETELIFRINRSLFVGDLFSAGKMREEGGDTETVRHELRKVFSSLEGFFYVFPGHGPPTTLDIERNNLGI